MPSTQSDRVDGFSTSLAVKARCLYSTTGNISLAGLGAQAGGDWATALEDKTRILVQDQDDSVDNGIWVASAGRWTRARDFDGSRDATQGTLVFVYAGESRGRRAYHLTTPDPIVIGTSALTFELWPEIAGEAELISYDDPVAPAYLKTVSDILNGIPVSILRFISTSRHADIRAGTDTGDLSSAFNAAFLAIPSAKRGTLYVPTGVYYIDSRVDGNSNINFVGDGIGASIIRADNSGAWAGSQFAFDTKSKFLIRDIAFDANNATYSVDSPFLILQACTDAVVERISLNKFRYIGLGFESCQEFTVRDSTFERDTAVNTTNYSINVSSSISTSRLGRLIGNHCNRSPVIVDGTEIDVISNKIRNVGYGGGIATTGDSSDLVVAFNECSQGTGIDVDGVDVCGIEHGAQFSLIHGNRCYGNAGFGIGNIGQHNIISNNICYNNGVIGTAAKNRAGIINDYADATHNGGGALVTGNRCFDTGGGDQVYGYYEPSANMDNIVLEGNNFESSATEIVIASATQVNGGYEASMSWDPSGGSGTLAANTQAVQAVVLPGAAFGDYVEASFSADLNGLSISANVSGANAVKVLIRNSTGSGIAITTGTVRVKAFKRR